MTHTATVTTQKASITRRARAVQTAQTDAAPRATRASETAVVIHLPAALMVASPQALLMRVIHTNAVHAATATTARRERRDIARPYKRTGTRVHPPPAPVRRWMTRAPGQVGIG